MLDFRNPCVAKIKQQNNHDRCFRQSLVQQKVLPDNFVVHQQLHRRVVFQQCHQLRISTDLILNIAHSRTKARSRIGVTSHTTGQELLLSRILLQHHGVFANTRIFWFDDGAKSLEDVGRRLQIRSGTAAGNVQADNHEVARLLLSAWRQLAQQLQQILLHLINSLVAGQSQSLQAKEAVQNGDHEHLLVSTTDLRNAKELLEQIIEQLQRKALSCPHRMKRLLALLVAHQVLHLFLDLWAQGVERFAA